MLLRRTLLPPGVAGEIAQLAWRRPPSRSWEFYVKGKLMKKWIGGSIAMLAVALCFALPAAGGQAPVRGGEGTIDLPTYVLGEEDPNPPFALINSKRIYPYTMLDDLTDRREMKTYRTLVLENEYLKATILPDMGGRLYSLYDKPARKEVFYRNHVVKYGLVAKRGAWISGGIEFNFPDGHTVATVSPVCSRLVHNGEDGSASAIVGDVDQVTGMYWQVALTLRPGQARLEQRVTLFNSTALGQLYWYWANAAVPATPDMQFVYPMREANPHVRNEVRPYPVWNGVDYSWYRNIRQPTSLFGRQVRRNFFGAYYHDSDYGVVHVADFREVPGKKVWSWGVADDGLLWTDLLTDRDGPYNEIQSGRFETQLDREFMPPRRVESWTEFWYPVRGLEGGFVEATRDLVLNVAYPSASDPGRPRLKLAVYPSVNIARAVLRVKAGGRVLREFSPVEFKTGAAATFTLPLTGPDAGTKNLEVEIVNSVGRPLLRWSAADPVDGNPDFVPAAGVSAPRPKAREKMTAEELYLQGLQQEKEGQDEGAVQTYRQVLERDPGYIPALLRLAWRGYRAADFRSAQNLLAHALNRDPSAADLHYAAGIVHRASGQWGLAQDEFWNSIRLGGSLEQALAQLGEISIHEKKYGEAEGLLRRALSYNPGDALVLSDLAVALRLDGKNEEAGQAAGQALKIMPLLPYALAEKARSTVGSGGISLVQSLPAILGSDEWNSLEVAAWYRGLDDLASSDAVLEAAAENRHGPPVSPLVYYYLAANAWREGRDDRTMDFAAKAAAAPFTKVFPQRIADAEVLADVVSHSPAAGRARAFLGNFLFAHGRYDEAAMNWTQAIGAGFDDSVLQRNLGLHAWRVKGDLDLAAVHYRKAIQMAPLQYRLYPDLDEIYTELQDRSGRAQLFSQAPSEVLERDTVRVRHALWLVEQRQFDPALRLLADHRFKPWEGGAIVRQVFVFANLEKAREALLAGQFTTAEQAVRQALEYPTNLGVGRPDNPDDAEPLYWLGEILQAEGKRDAALAAWQTAAAIRPAAGVSAVFRALALRRLGQVEEASGVLESFSRLSDDAGAEEFFTAGLAERFGGREQAAQADFRRALELAPSFWKARLASGRAQPAGKP